MADETMGSRVEPVPKKARFESDHPAEDRVAADIYSRNSFGYDVINKHSLLEHFSPKRYYPKTD